MDVRFSSLAVEELDDAALYYEQEQPGVGTRFLAAVEDAVRQLARMPTLWPLVDGDIRRCVLRRFPYSVFYAVEPDHVLVVAIAHQHRRPDYWQGRPT